MRRHPVIFGFVLLFVIGIISFLISFCLFFFSGETFSLSSGEKIGIIYVKGMIIDSKNVTDQINRYAEDGRIKAVVIRVDSPGGGVAASQEIYDAVLALKKRKKVIVSMGSVAASGGYYIACGADKILANPGTVTGSIGAIMHFTNLEGTLKKVGLKSSAVKSGRYKDIGSPFRNMSADEKGLLQGVIDDIYDQFLEVVSTSRNIPKDQLKRIADGRIFTGRQALKLGLVDSLGDQEAAIKLAAKIAGLKGKPEVIYPKEKGFTIWKYIFEGNEHIYCEGIEARDGGRFIFFQGVSAGVLEE